MIAKLWRRLLRRRRLSPDTRRLAEAADRARDDRRWDPAIELYRKALDQASWHPGIWVQYGHVLKEVGRLNEAATAYETALTLRPERAAVHVHLGHVRGRLGDLDGAVDACLTALALEPTSLWIVDALRDVRRQGGVIDPAAVERRLGLIPGQAHPLWIDAQIDHVGAREVRGWIVDVRRPDARLEPELWIDGLPVAATLDRTFRRDLQDRFGGDGRLGFVMAPDGVAHGSDAPRVVEVRLDGQVIAARFEDGFGASSKDTTITLEAYPRFRAAFAGSLGLNSPEAPDRPSISVLRMPDDVDDPMDAVNEIVLVIDRDDVLADDALDNVSRLFASDDTIEVVTLDEEVGPDPWQPLLRGGYDRDLLLQTPYVGSGVAFRASALKRIGLRPEAGTHIAADALLRLDPVADAVRHLPRVSSSRGRNEAAAVGWLACVRAALGDDPGVSIEPHVDALGAQVSGSVRVQRSVEGASATIVIPTRDALELLAPCVESVLASLPHNRTMVDIVIVDHESEQPETLGWLSSRSAPVSVEHYAGPFNWARMNNIQAARSRSDVLIFLNNDTCVLTLDWIDELVSQALRPQVGVVGARLIYDDRTLQHAGIVAREGEAIFLTHEGVGDPGDDPGYLGRHALMHRAVAVTGAAMAVRRDLFERLGGFDDATLPVEGNDVDLCMRAASAGHAVLYDPYATLYHLESKSRGFSRTGSKKAVADAAARVLWDRWGDRFGRDPWVSPSFAITGKPFTRLRRPFGID